MNRQQYETFSADVSRVMISLQLDDLILRPNLKSKTTCHRQRKNILPTNGGLSLPLSVEDCQSERL